MQNRQIRFNPLVPYAEFSQTSRTDDSIRHSFYGPLVEGDEVHSRNSEFQLTSRAHKRILHEHHCKRKKCRLYMRQDITDAFWDIYEQQALNRFQEITCNEFHVLTGRRSNRSSCTRSAFVRGQERNYQTVA